jgi:hypothetical protein
VADAPLVRRVLVTVLLGGGPVQSSTDPALHVFTVDTVFKDRSRSNRAWCPPPTAQAAGSS